MSTVPQPNRALKGTANMLRILVPSLRSAAL